MTTTVLFRLSLITLVVGSLVGCDAGPPPAGGRPRDAGALPDAPGGINYREHVAPILAEHCFHCHSEGGISGIELDDFASAVRLSSRIAERTADRTMPPWYADNSGDCRTYEHANWLTDEELAVLAVWATTRQEGPTSVPIPPPRTLNTLERVDHDLDIGAPYTPAPRGDDQDTFRCFRIDPSWTGDVFLVGYQVAPGEPRVVHHLIAYEPEVDESAAIAALEAQDPEQGWRCDGGPGVAAHPVVLWAPGGGAVSFPTGTGVRLGERPMILQMHYNVTAAGPLPDLTHVRLMTAPSVPTEAFILPVADYDMALNPRMASVSTTGSAPVPTNARIWGVFPHMHQRGVDLDVRVTGGTEACLIDMTHWDFGWQTGYFFTEPQTVRTGDRLEVTCTYDTLEDSDTVRWGETTADEMCINYVYATR